MVGRLSRGLAKAGHIVTVVTSAEPGVPLREEADGVAIVRLPLRRLAGFRVPRGYLRVLATTPRDILHVHGQRVWPSDVLLPFLRGVGGPKVFTPHGFYQWHMNPSPLDRLYYKRWFARRAAHFERVIALTEGERRTLLSWGLPADRVAVIPQGVEPEELEGIGGGYLVSHGIEARPVILYVGGFYPNKRVDLLLRSMQRAQVDASLVAVGVEGRGGWGFQRLRDLARELGLDVHLPGPLPRRALISLYHDSDVVALPSLFEGFGLVLLEAMAAGIPFVSTRVGIAQELAEGGAGVVVPDISEMGPAIANLLANADLRRNMAESGRTMVRAYTWKRVIDAHLELYQNLLAKQASNAIGGTG